MKRVLLTGFEPFGGDAVNPSWEVARALDGAWLDGARVTARQLPCVFGQALEALQAAAAEGPWDVVLCLGLAGNRDAFSVERVAINVDDARIPDNAGAQPVDRPVVAGAPAAYFSTLPIKRMVQTLQAAQWPAQVSQTAGTYVCNHVFFGLMHWASGTVAAPRCGFMHLPPLALQPLTHQIEVVRCAIAAALTEGPDDVWSNGTVA